MQQEAKFSFIMKTIVFAGPSINQALREEFSHLSFRPPAQQGDIYQAAEFGKADRLLILDGYYKTVPAVWHKEVIHAVNNGLRVIGAASLGALRAVELEAYGMQGHGRIFEWYRSGILNRDPDVAVAHANADDDFRTLTVPIVNILATLTDSGHNFDCLVIEEVLYLARSVFFEHRTMGSLLATVTATPTLNNNQKDQIIDALKNSYIDQKYKDSQATLEWLERGGDKSNSDLTTENLNKTLYWDAMVVNDSYIGPSDTGLLLTKQALLVFQLLEKPEDYMRMRERSVTIELCLWLASLYGVEADEITVAQMKEQLLAELELNESGLIEWLEERGMSEQNFTEYLNVCAIEREMRDRVQYRNPMCCFNRYHYATLALSKNSREVIDSFKELERRLGEETISAVDEVSEIIESFPKESLDVIDKYRQEMMLKKSTSTIGDVTRIPINYTLTFSKLYGKSKELVNAMLYRLFTGGNGQ